MTNYYIQPIELYENKVCVYRSQRQFIATDTDPKLQESKEIEITWNNLESILCHYADDLGLTMGYKKRKGKIIYFQFYITTPCIKEWRQKETGLSFKIFPAKVHNTSLDTIIHYPNSDLAIQYLLERGVALLK